MGPPCMKESKRDMVFVGNGFLLDYGSSISREVIYTQTKIWV